MGPALNRESEKGCHSERSEESRTRFVSRARFLASLGMTAGVPSLNPESRILFLVQRANVSNDGGNLLVLKLAAKGRHRRPFLAVLDDFPHFLVFN